MFEHQTLTLTCRGMSHPQSNGGRKFHRLGRITASQAILTHKLEVWPRRLELGRPQGLALGKSPAGHLGLMWFCNACHDAGLRDMRAPVRLDLVPVLDVLAAQRIYQRDSHATPATSAALRAELARLGGLDERAAERRALSLELFSRLGSRGPSSRLRLPPQGGRNLRMTVPCVRCGHEMRDVHPKALHCSPACRDAAEAEERYRARRARRAG